MKLRDAGDHEFHEWLPRKNLAAFGAGENERRDDTCGCTLDDTWAIARGYVVESDDGKELMYAVWDRNDPRCDVPVVRLVLEDKSLASDDDLMLEAFGMVLDRLEEQFGDVAAWVSRYATRAHDILSRLGMKLTDRPNPVSEYDWWTRSGKTHVEPAS